ncbi:MAG: hypothetical protein GY816_15445 [Cytophagales bacterium]|nr:hypothetical protein [Cytophagales bacterium]
MKYVLILYILLSFSASAQSKDEARKQVWNLLETYHLDAHYFIQELYNMPLKYKSEGMTLKTSKPEDFMVYVDDYSVVGVLSAFGVVVHESSHGYSSKRVFPSLIEKNIPIDFDQRYTVYFIKKGEEYLVKHTPTFPSRKMANEIRGDLRSFRWSTYIRTSQNLLSTQQHGVYGLMNEWTAYFNGMKAIVDGFPEYKRLTGGDPTKYKLFLEDAGSIKISYPEFKYYILHYLEYASRKEKNMYKEILENDEFRRAYRAIDRAFSEIIHTYNQRVLEIGVEVKASGLSFNLDEDGYLFIGNRGVSTYEKENSAFIKAINSTKYQKIRSDLAK